MSGPTVSVVIPTFNRAQFLKRSISSVLAQLREGDELIVVDDGSTDDTPEVLGEFEGRIRILEGTHQGVGAARNRGVQAGENEIVAFMDSDDEWMPGKMDLQRRLFTEDPGVLFTFGDMIASYPDGRESRRHLRHWHQDPRPWSEILPEVRPFSDIGPLPDGWDDFNLYSGSLYADLAHRPYVFATTAAIRRSEAGDALWFADDIP